MKRMTVTITADQDVILRKKADAVGLTVSAYVRVLLNRMTEQGLPDAASVLQTPAVQVSASEPEAAPVIQRSTEDAPVVSYRAASVSDIASYESGLLQKRGEQDRALVERQIKNAGLEVTASKEYLSTLMPHDADYSSAKATLDMKQQHLAKLRAKL